MRRIKSAPSNLAKMSHKKKDIKPTSLTTKPCSCIFIYINSKKSNNILPIKEKLTNKKCNNILPIKEKRTNNELNKSWRANIKTLGNLFSDTITEIYNEKCTLEETSLICAIINYLSNNIFKKDKLKELYYLSIKSFIRYFIMLYIHTHILHDKIDNNIIEMLPNIINKN